MAFTSIAALVAGEAATTTLVLSAVAEIGTAMTVVGAVTGNKDLMKIGGVMGLVGGVGGLVNNALSDAGTASMSEAFSTGADQSAAESARLGVDASGNAITDAAGNMTGAAANGAGGLDLGGANLDQFNQMGDASGITAGPGDTLSSAQNTVTGSTQPAQQTAAPLDGSSASTAKPADVTGSVSTQQAPGQVTGAPVGQAPTAAQAPDAASAPTAETAPGADPYNAAKDSQSYNNMLPNGGKAPASSGDFFGNMSKWMTSNKDLVNTGVKVVGGVLQGMQQQANFDAQMNYTKEQNARAGTWATSYQPKGIINSQMPRV